MWYDGPRDDHKIETRSGNGREGYDNSHEELSE